jgi:hypothetical protein
LRARNDNRRYCFLSWIIWKRSPVLRFIYAKENDPRSSSALIVVWKMIETRLWGFLCSLNVY